MPKKKETFETRLARLKTIVEQLEDQELPLEDGVALFKEGVELAKNCREQVETAKNDVRILLKGALTEFPVEEDDG